MQTPTHFRQLYICWRLMSKKTTKYSSATIAGCCPSPVSAGKDGSVDIKLTATPGAKHNSILEIGEEVRVSIASPPVDGKANTELLRYLADVLGVKKSQVSLTKGQKSRDKVVTVSVGIVEEILQKLKQELK
ncbi:UPF0235 protein HY04AAS1_1378-like isoform X2 [Dreissena polymorpha]|nr:UPF0235 protein HY04AAS1_1378-like isoform X2 [Dreissena polymorpha]